MKSVTFVCHEEEDNHHYEDKMSEGRHSSEHNVMVTTLSFYYAIGGDVRPHYLITPGVTVFYLRS